MNSGKQTSESEEKAVEAGAWELCDVADEFGDLTGDKCLKLLGDGTYSSKYDNDEYLKAILFAYQDYTIKIRLLKNGSQLVDNFSGHIKIKDGCGDVHDIQFTDDNLGQIEPYLDEKEVVVVWGKEISTGEGKKEFREIIEKEGVLSAIAETGGGLFSTKYTYKFKFNLDGFKKAMSILQSKKWNANQYDESDYDDGGFDIDDSESDDSEPVSDEEIEAIKESVKFKIDPESDNEESGLDNNKSTSVEENTTYWFLCHEPPWLTILQRCLFSL